MGDPIPIPPGADNPGPKEARQVSVEVVDSPVPTPEIEEEKVGLLRRMFRAGYSALCACGRGIATAANYAWHGVKVAYSWTLDPMFNFIERWVPGASCVRKVLPWYLFGMALVSGFLVGLLAIEAGYGLLSVPLMLIGAIVVPILVFSMPAFWPQFAVDMWFLSVIWNVLDSAEDAIRGRCGFFASFSTRMWPGVADKVIARRAINEIKLAEATV